MPNNQINPIDELDANKLRSDNTTQSQNFASMYDTNSLIPNQNVANADTTPSVVQPSQNWNALEMEHVPITPAQLSTIPIQNNGASVSNVSPTGEDLSNLTGYSTNPNSSINNNTTNTPGNGSINANPSAIADAINAANGQQSSYSQPTAQSVANEYQTDKILGQGLYAIPSNLGVTPEERMAVINSADDYYNNKITGLARNEYYAAKYGFGPQDAQYATMDYSDPQVLQSQINNPDNSVMSLAMAAAQNPKTYEQMQLHFPAKAALVDNILNNLVSQQTGGAVNQWNSSQAGANIAALTHTMTKQLEQNTAQEAALSRLDKNGTLFQQTFENSNINKDIPLVNIITNPAQYGLGSDSVAAYDGMITDLKSDFQAVQGSTSGMSESVREAADAVINNKASYNQIVTVLKYQQALGKNSIDSNKQIYQKLQSSFQNNLSQAIGSPQGQSNNTSDAGAF